MPSCLILDYDLMVASSSGDALVEGIVQACSDGQVFGDPVVTIGALNLELDFSFTGNSAQVFVSTIDPKDNLLEVCDIEPLDAVPDCAPPQKKP